MMVASNHNTGGPSKFFRLCVSGILRLWFYNSVRAPKALGNSIPSSPIQAISQSIIQTVGVIAHRIQLP